MNIRKEGSSKRNERILYVAIWAAVAILPIILGLWDGINNNGFRWKPVIGWWIGMIPLIAIFLINNHFLIPQFMNKGRMRRYWLILLAVFVVYGSVQYAVEKQHQKEFKERMMVHKPHAEFNAPPPPPPGPDMKMPMPPRPFPFPIIFKIILAAMTIGINIAISLSFSYIREQANRKELENRRLQEELKYLRQQISPHFLMNVLNNIHEMTEENIKEAQDMILELSYLMRYVLYESENETTNLAAESRFISSYVALMKRRYVEDMVKVNLGLPDQTSKSINLPPLLFISFIENAFKHGVSYNNETSIDIKLCEADGKIIFNCENTIPSTHVNPAQGGVGLTNVRRRLDLLYGENYSLSIKQNENIYSVNLIIPCQ